MSPTADGAADTVKVAHQGKSFDVVFISSFTGEDCNGNVHAVVIDSQMLSGSLGIALSQKVAPAIVVAVHTHEQSRSADTQFFHYGKRVDWCGSGILAAAKALSSERHTVDIIRTRCAQFRLVQHQDLFGFAADSGFLWRPVRNSALWQQFFRHTLVRALESPSQKGYTLIELNDEYAVANWRPQFSHLQRHSQRALIITAWAQPTCPYDYVVRYFAPQYGNDEDDATGSANALLIAYWSKCLNQSWLVGRQLSAAGGEFYGRHLGRGKVALFGKTQITRRATVDL